MVFHCGILQVIAASDARAGGGGKDGGPKVMGLVALAYVIAAALMC